MCGILHNCLSKSIIIVLYYYAAYTLSILLKKAMLLCDKCNKINTQSQYFIIYKGHLIFESSMLKKNSSLFLN